MKEDRLNDALSLLGGKMQQAVDRSMFEGDVSVNKFEDTCVFQLRIDITEYRDINIQERYEKAEKGDGDKRLPFLREIMDEDGEVK